MTLVDFDSIKKTSVFTCMVNSKQYTLKKTSNAPFIILSIFSMLII